MRPFIKLPLSDLMDITEYYNHQGKARGLTTIADFNLFKRQLKGEYAYVFKKWLPPDRTATIIEVACGPGIFLSLMRDDGYINITGTDLDSKYISLAQSMELPVERRDSIEWLKSLDPSSVNAVIACNFYEHIPKETFLDFISVCYRVLASGGVLILEGPNADSPLVGRNLFNDITHYWAYTSTSLKALSQMMRYSSIEFKDGALAGIAHNAALKRPIVKISQRFMRLWYALSTRESINYWGTCLWSRWTK